jgi:hypothetical protein
MKRARAELDAIDGQVFRRLEDEWTEIGDRKVRCGVSAGLLRKLVPWTGRYPSYAEVYRSLRRLERERSAKRWGERPYWCRAVPKISAPS